MVIKVKDPKRWVLLPQGDIIALEGEGRRPVRLEVNAVTEASFQVVYPDASVAFLAAFRGMEVIEFVAEGPVEVWVTSTGDVHFYTDDGRNVAFVDDGQVSFAQPHQRRSESEQLIYMQGLMLANMQRRNEELEAFRAAAEAMGAENGEDDSGTGEGELSPGAGGQGVDPSADAGAGGVDGQQPAA